MGGIGIWCMHYIGNRVINFSSSNDEIVYSSCFTALSFFLTTAVLPPSFYLLASTARARTCYIAVAAFFTGMHYIGNRGIINQPYHNWTASMISSMIIAVCASVNALSVFFCLQDTWTNSWWKRAICGLSLAEAVSGKHWTATTGTS